jgi:hypothetical protein
MPRLPNQAKPHRTRPYRALTQLTLPCLPRLAVPRLTPPSLAPPRIRPNIEVISTPKMGASGPAAGRVHRNQKSRLGHCVRGIVSKSRDTASLSSEGSRHRKIASSRPCAGSCDRRLRPGSFYQRGFGTRKTAAYLVGQS